MAIEDNFPTMTDVELNTLLGNVIRLSTTGTDRQRLEAARLHPLIDAEKATRVRKAPPKAPARKKAAAKTPSKAKATPSKATV